MLYRTVFTVFLLVLFVALSFPKYENFMVTVSRDYRDAVMQRLSAKPYGLEYVTRPHGRMFYDRFPRLMCHINRFYDSRLVDGNDLLTIRHCIEIDNKNQTLQQNMERFSAGAYAFYTRKIEMRASKMRDVYKQVIQTLKDIRDQNDALQGPVFLFLFQAPYYRDKDGNVISVTNENIHSYNYQSHIILNQSLQSGLPVFENQMVAYLLLPMHNVNGVQKTSIADPKKYLKDCLSWLRDKKSESKVCKMFCLDDSSTFCGCINTSPANGAAYESKCTTSDTPPAVRDYGMLYRINENSPSVSSLFTDTYISDLDLDA